MKDFTVYKKTVFFTKEPVKIYDFRGIIFYDSDFVKKFNGFFSLPRGKYKSDCDFQVKNIVFNDHRKIKLPPYERNFFHNWDEFKIIFADNPSKCTISHHAKTITYDKQFCNKPLFVPYFILAHEMGHNYYEDEINADRFAVKKMLHWGFNLSQIGLAPLLSLSDNQPERKIKVIESLINSNRYG